MPLRRLVHVGDELGSSVATYLTFSSNLTEGGALLASVTITNRASARRLVSVFFIASGGSAADNNCIFEEYVPPNRSVGVPGGPWWGNSSAFVQATSDTAGSAVGIRLTALEEFHAGA